MTRSCRSEAEISKLVGLGIVSAPLLTLMTLWYVVAKPRRREMTSSAAIVPMDASAGHRLMWPRFPANAVIRLLTLTTEPQKGLGRRACRYRTLATHAPRAAQLALEALLVNPDAIIHDSNRP